MLWARPTPLSSMPPCHTGTSCRAARSWTASEGPCPPSRPGLMLMIRHALERHRVLSGAERVDRLVQADGRRQPALQRRVVAEVVVVQRLLDHHQVEAIERGQVIGIRQRVSGIGVHHQRHVAARLADAGDRGDVPARPDLDLDSPIAGRPFDLHPLDELVERILDPDRHAGLDRAGACRPARRPAAVPARCANRSHAAISTRRLGHVMTADRASAPNISRG